jgi:hypothetical protein
MACYGDSFYHEDIRGSGCIDRRLLHFGTRWGGSDELHAVAALPLVSVG